MQTLPIEVVEEEILQDLPLPDLLRACQVNRTIRSICNKESFWQNKVEWEYEFGDEKPEELSWKELYIGLHRERIRPITISLGNTTLKKWIETDDSLYNIVDDAATQLGIELPFEVVFTHDNDEYNYIYDTEWELYQLQSFTADDLEALRFYPKLEEDEDE